MLVPKIRLFTKLVSQIFPFIFRKCQHPCYSHGSRHLPEDQAVRTTRQDAVSAKVSEF